MHTLFFIDLLKLLSGLTEHDSEESSGKIGLSCICLCEFLSRALMKPFELYPWTKTIMWNAITVRWVETAHISDGYKTENKALHIKIFMLQWV